MRNLIHSLKSQISLLTIGSLLMTAFIVLSWFYYNTHESQKDQWLFKTIDSLHSQSIDLRMRSRDIDLSEKQMAVIAIDNRSLEKHGRWPWSRKKVSTLIQNLFDEGVETIALDILFSEPSNKEVRAAFTDFQRLPLDPKSSALVSSLSRQKFADFDHDKDLGLLFKKYSDRLIAGSVYDIPRISYSPYQRLCHALVYQKTKSYEKLESEGYDFIHLITDQNLKIYEELPSSLHHFLNLSLEKIQNKEMTKLSNNKAPQTRKDISLKQRQYCSQWLKPNKDTFFDDFKKHWPEIQKSHPEFKQYNLTSFLNHFRQTGLHSALLPVDHWQLNIDDIHQHTRFTGFLNVHPDIDGTIRKLPLLVRTGPHIIPSLSTRFAMSLKKSDGGQISIRKNPLNPSHFEVIDMELTKEANVIHSIQVDSQGNGRLNFYGPKYTFPHVSANEILDTKKDIRVTQLTKKKNQLSVERNKATSRSYLKGKSVIIGATAVGIYDLRVTPFDENYPGVEGHLTSAHNILNNNFLHSPRNEPPLMALGLIVLGIFIIASTSFLTSLPSFLLFISTFFAIIFIDYFYFFQKRIVLTIIFPLALIIALYATLTLYKYFTEEKKKKMIRGTFEKYVSPAIVKEILQHPDNLKLGGKKEEMSVFFSDVRGFTTISETLDPEELSDLLNFYLTPMTKLVFENNGTLDKYMGDAIMAFFGAPVKSQTHPEDACRCALQNIEHLNELNKQLAEKKLPQIDIGIGINTGEMSVGNMGSETVRNYTVMGDAVNLGARLEGINKQYGTRIIISEFTEKLLSEQFIRREIDWVKVKGKEKPVKIYELMQEGALSQERKELLTHFRRGFHHYHQMNWEEAIEEFKLAMTFQPKDSVSKLYIQRCHEFISHPPEGEWDGVFTMKTK